jgi:hypothetical protein
LLADALAGDEPRRERDEPRGEQRALRADPHGRREVYRPGA